MQYWKNGSGKRIIIDRRDIWREEKEKEVDQGRRKELGKMRPKEPKERRNFWKGGIFRGANFCGGKIWWGRKMGENLVGEKNGGKILPGFADKMKYLGVKIQKWMSCTTHVNKRVTKAGKLMNMV
jgi:hypothetical protein